MTNYANPPIPPTWRLLAQNEITPAISQWAVAELASHRNTNAPPMFGYEEQSFPDEPNLRGLVCWHPPDAINEQWHSGVTVYQETDPSAVYPNPLTFPTLVMASAKLGAMGVDTDTKLTSTSAAALKSAGMDFIVRYVSLGGEAAGDLTAAEAQAVCGAGLALMIVQHVRAPGWTPSRDLGAQYGAAAAVNAEACGYPKGCTLWCDLEGAVGTAADVMAYVNAWASAVTSKSYQAGLYVGAGSILNADQLYSLAVVRYWRSQSQVANVSNRGYCMMQLYPTTTVSGVSVDLDVVQSDYKGGLPSWAVASMS